MARIKRANEQSEQSPPPEPVHTSGFIREMPPEEVQAYEAAQASPVPEAPESGTGHGNIYDQYAILEEDRDNLVEANNDLLEAVKDLESRLYMTESENKELRRQLELTQRHLAMSDAALKKARPNATLADDVSVDDDSVWVAALPEAGVTVAPLVFGGKEAEKRTDEDNYVHFRVTRAQAEALLGSRSGLKFVLTGPDTVDKMEITRANGNYSETITVYRHVKAKYPSGGVYWQPKIVDGEESK